MFANDRLNVRAEIIRKIECSEFKAFQWLKHAVMTRNDRVVPKMLELWHTYDSHARWLRRYHLK